MEGEVTDAIVNEDLIEALDEETPKDKLSESGDFLIKRLVEILKAIYVLIVNTSFIDRPMHLNCCVS